MSTGRVRFYARGPTSKNGSNMPKNFPAILCLNRSTFGNFIPFWINFAKIFVFFLVRNQKNSVSKEIHKLFSSFICHHVDLKININFFREEREQVYPLTDRARPKLLTGWGGPKFFCPNDITNLKSKFAVFVEFKICCQIVSNLLKSKLVEVKKL